MDEKIEARVSHRFKATAEQVYDAWLDPQQVRLWMSAALKSFGLSGDIQRIEIDARVGGAFLFSDRRGDTEARHWGTYLVLDRPHKIVFQRTALGIAGKRHLLPHPAMRHEMIHHQTCQVD